MDLSLGGVGKLSMTSGILDGLSREFLMVMELETCILGQNIHLEEDGMICNSLTQNMIKSTKIISKKMESSLTIRI